MISYARICLIRLRQDLLCLARVLCVAHRCERLQCAVIDFVLRCEEVWRWPIPTVITHQPTGVRYASSVWREMGIGVGSATVPMTCRPIIARMSDLAGKRCTT